MQLGKAGPNFIVLGATFAKVIVTLCRDLTVGADKLNSVLVHLDAWQNTTLLEGINKRLSSSSLLVESLLKEDDLGTRGAKEELTKGLPVCLNIFNIDVG